jgi:hypothetical protein
VEAELLFLLLLLCLFILPPTQLLFTKEHYICTFQDLLESDQHLLVSA